MGRLLDFTLDDLHGHLERTEGNTPAHRVLSAIDRKRGTPSGELAERHSVAE